MPPVEVPKFGGLDLQDDPQDVGFNAAVDMLDVDLDVRGQVRSRDGFTKFTQSAAASRYSLLFASYEPSGSLNRLFAVQPSTTKVVAHDLSAITTTSATLAAAPVSMAHYGGASASSAMYGGTGTSLGTLLKYTGGAFSYPAVPHSGYHAAVTPTDNRLALGYCDDSPDRVRFSDAGAPETFSTNNYVDLWPSDGSYIRGLYAYRDQLFAFKERRFAVFYGTSTDGTGQPVFNYNPVDVGIGMHGTAACSSPNGIYFLGEDGIYLTTGGAPVKVSKALDPLFNASAGALYSGSAIHTGSAVTTAVMAWQNGRLYVALPTGSSSVNDRLFVLDPDLGWLVWSLPVAGMVSWVTPGAPLLRLRSMYFSYASGTNDIGYITHAATSDDGTAINGRYRTGFWTPGQAGSTAWIRELLMDGTGQVTVKTAVNDAANLGGGQAVTLGASPAVTQGRDRRGVYGRNVSYEFSGSAPWSLSRATAMVQGQRAPGVAA